MPSDNVVIVAICGITVLEGIALACGHDGLILTTVISVLAGMGGFKLKETLDIKKRQNEDMLEVMDTVKGPI